MKLLLASFLFLGIFLERSSAGVTHCDCGKANSVRIVGGTYTKLNEYPWTVAIKKNDFTRCTGSIISPRHILTAAHCYRTPEESTVTVGAHDVNNNSEDNAQTYEVEAFIEHPHHNTTTRHNDIAIIVTKEPIKFNKFVSPICFPTEVMNNNDLIGRKASVQGWGKVRNEGTAEDKSVFDDTDKSRKLKVLDQNFIVPFEKCENAYKAMDEYASNSFICTVSHEGQSCQGDSGGPVVMYDEETKRNILIGVINVGMVPCKPDDDPVLSANVSFFRDWVLSHVNALGVDVCSKN